MIGVLVVCAVVVLTHKTEGHCTYVHGIHRADAPGDYMAATLYPQASKSTLIDLHDCMVHARKNQCIRFSLT